MKLVIINGSPRAKKSNSEVIGNWIANSLDKATNISKFYTIRVNTHKAAVESIEDSSTVLVIFPLYVDAMPATAKLFFEELGTIANKKKDVKIYFIVHSGFQGAKHCRAVEKYLVYLAEYLGFIYMGTAIKAGSEGIRLMPEEAIIDTKNDFIELAKDISNGSRFSGETLKSLAGFELPPEEYIKGIKQSKGNTGYFSYLLQMNNALDKSFDKPYQKKE